MMQPSAICYMAAHTTMSHGRHGRHGRHMVAHTTMSHGHHGQQGRHMVAHTTMSHGCTNHHVTWLRRPSCAMNMPTLPHGTHAIASHMTVLDFLYICTTVLCTSQCYTFDLPFPCELCMDVFLGTTPQESHHAYMTHALLPPHMRVTTHT